MPRSSAISDTRMNSKLIKVKGLVIRATEFGEDDLLFTVLTEELGRLPVIVKGASGKKGFSHGVSVGYYMSFVLYKKGTMCWHKESELLEPFLQVRGDLLLSALSGYILDVAYELSDDGQECYDILGLTYNTLYALAYRPEIPSRLVKAAFELKAMSISGYMPTVTECHICGKVEGDLWFDVMNGGLICSSCMKKKSNEVPQIYPNDEDFHSVPNIICPLSYDVICAMHYVICSPLSKMLSFRLDGEEELRLLENACNTYLINHLERDFDSLKYYLSIRDKLKKAEKDKKNTKI